MTYSDHEQALRAASALSAVTTGCCLRYGLFASILRQPVTNIDSEGDAFHHYYDLLRTIGLSTTEDMIHPTRTWPICRLGGPEPVERYFLQGFHRWHVEWVEVVAVEDIVLPTDPVLLSLQTIVGLSDGPCCLIAWHSSMREPQRASERISCGLRSGSGVQRR